LLPRRFAFRTRSNALGVTADLRAHGCVSSLGAHVNYEESPIITTGCRSVVFLACGCTMVHHAVRFLAQCAVTPSTEAKCTQSHSAQCGTAKTCIAGRHFDLCVPHPFRTTITTRFSPQITVGTLFAFRHESVYLAIRIPSASKQIQARITTRTKAHHRKLAAVWNVTFAQKLSPSLCMTTQSNACTQEPRFSRFHVLLASPHKKNKSPGTSVPPFTRVEQSSYSRCT
jgi:hypothetical protein